MIEMPADYKRLHDPERSEHYVYRITDKKGRVLYIGYTMDLERRFGEHRRSGWFRDITIHMDHYGPYSYREALEVERAWIAVEQPRFNTEWTRGYKRGVQSWKQAASA